MSVRGQQPKSSVNEGIRLEMQSRQATNILALRGSRRAQISSCGMIGATSSTRLRERIKRLGPYTSAAFVLVPLLIVEPLKLAALWIVGEGHWFAGTVSLIIAYAGSLFVVERLFRVLKPNILRAPALAKGWACFIVVRRTGYRYLKKVLA